MITAATSTNIVRFPRLKYVYENGVYTVCSDERFRGYIKRFIEDFDPALVRMKDVDEAFRNISAGLMAIPFERLNDNEDIINFRNGLLKLSTMELLPHSPEVLSTIQLSCDWTGEDAPTPCFDSYLQESNHPVKGVFCHLVFTLRCNKAMLHLEITFGQRIN